MAPVVITSSHSKTVFPTIPSLPFTSNAPFRFTNRSARRSIVCDAVGHTARRLHKRRHVSGHELLDGLVDLALERFGYLADLVLESWGVTCTDDIGKIVFHLVAVGLLSKRDEDSQDDFHNVFDLRRTLRQRHTIRLGDEDDPQQNP